MKNYLWLVVGAVIVSLSTVMGRLIILMFYSGVNLEKEYDLLLSSSINSFALLGTLIFIFGAAKTLISREK